MNSEGFLGIKLDNVVKWYSHTEKVSGIISAKIRILNQIKNYVNEPTLKTLYYTIIHPHLIYGLVLWGRTFEKGLTRQVRLQKRAIRIVTCAKRDAHAEP